ncbi:MAG: 16S rRNA (guanine(527)-N(7))-methyltransferase RsmG [Candidatus Velamenicoccus archaeovorus]
MAERSPRSRVPRAAELLRLDLRPQQLARLDALAAMLAGTAVDAGLISEADRDDVVERHVIDSLRAAAVVLPQDRLALDLGSGAGLPGLVVAIALPGLRVVLVESRRRRVAFLELAVQTLGTGNAVVRHARIEDVEDRADLCFTRALAPLRRSWALAAPRLRPGGRLVYFAGAGFSPPDRPDRLDPPALIEAVASPLLASSGPLVIMTRQ